MAFILYTIEFAIIGLLVVLWITQVAWPLVRGTQLFPLFRRRKLERLLTHTREFREQERLVQELSKEIQNETDSGTRAGG